MSLLSNVLQETLQNKFLLLRSLKNYIYKQHVFSPTRTRDSTYMKRTVLSILIQSLTHFLHFIVSLEHIAVKSSVGLGQISPHSNYLFGDSRFCGVPFLLGLTVPQQLIFFYVIHTIYLQKYCISDI